MEDLQKRTSIKSFRDLDVYKNSYRLMLEVHKDILPKLPSREKYDLVDQLSRSTKAIPRLIAEGYAKKHQKLGFHKYLDDAMSETNETIVSLEQARDLYELQKGICDKLVSDYDVLARQLYRLAQAWDDFKRRPKPETKDHTRV